MTTRFLLLCGLLACIGCGSIDPAFYTRDGRPLVELDPLPYRIAIAAFPAPHEFDGKQPADERIDYWMSLTDQDVHERIVALMDVDDTKADGLGLDALEIRSQRAANEVFRIAERDLAPALKRAQDEGADLLIMPRLAEPAAFTYVGTKRVVTSTLLWFFTWVGGLHVEDRSYDARLSLDFDIVNPYDGTTLATFTAVSRTMDLTLWERNARSFKSGVGWSLLMPPYVAFDNEGRVSRVLSEMVCARLAARLTGYLHQDFAAKERNLIGTLRSVEPKNGARRDWITLPFSAEIVADVPLSDATLFVNGEKNAWEAARGEEQASVYRIDVNPQPLALKPGRNVVRIEYAVRGRFTSRTLVYYRNGETDR